MILLIERLLLKVLHQVVPFYGFAVLKESYGLSDYQANCLKNNANYISDMTEILTSIYLD